MYAAGKGFFGRPYVSWALGGHLPWCFSKGKTTVWGGRLGKGLSRFSVLSALYGRMTIRSVGSGLHALFSYWLACCQSMLTSGFWSTVPDLYMGQYRAWEHGGTRYCHFCVLEMKSTELHIPSLCQGAWNLATTSPRQTVSLSVFFQWKKRRGTFHREDNNW